MPAGGAAFVDPSQAEPSCAEQVIGECGIHELDEERINYPPKYEYPACALKGYCSNYIYGILFFAYT